MSKIKKLAGETILYGLGSIVPRMLNFLLLPLHTKSAFTPEQYGIITTLFAVVTFLNVVFTFGMETTYFRFASKQDSNKKRVFDQAQTIVLAISVLLTFSFILLREPISNVFDVSENPEFITWLSLVMFLDAAVAIPFAQLRLNHKPIVFAVGKIINVAILMGLNYYFIIYGKTSGQYSEDIGVGYVFLANLIANGFYILYLFKPLISWRPRVDNALTKTMISYSFPIMLTGLAGMTNETFSRATLDWWLPANFYPGKSSEYVLGIFGACYKFAVLMNLAVMAFRFAAEPFFFANAQDKNSPKLFATVNHYFIITCCFLLVGVSLNLEILKYFTGSDYWEGLVIVPILLLGYLFLGIYYNISVWFKVTDKTYYGTIITIGGACITIVANYILIPIAGYIGSSLATLICFGSMAIACFLLGRKYFPVPYRIANGMAYIIASMAIIYLSRLLPIENPILILLVNNVILLVFIGFTYQIERRGLIVNLRSK